MDTHINTLSHTQSHTAGIFEIASQPAAHVFGLERKLEETLRTSAHICLSVFFNKLEVTRGSARVEIPTPARYGRLAVAPPDAPSLRPPTSASRSDPAVTSA